MKKFICLLPLMLLLIAVPAEAKKKKKSDLELPYPLTELANIHDSITREGYILYLKEKIAWNSEDIFFAQCTHQDMVQEMLLSGIYPTFSYIFFNKDSKQCIFEVKTNVEKGSVDIVDSIRPLTDKEITRSNLQERIYGAMNKLKLKINELPEGCNFNFDWIKVNENRYRVFIIMGCTKPHIIPWGNDLSYDCDSLGNVLDVRKYHNSSTLTATVMEGSKVIQVFHTHTNLHPLITSTDIALFLLYGEDLESFTVLTHAAYYTYNKETQKITVTIPK